MDIVVSANNNEEILIFPIVPKGEIDIARPQNNEEAETINSGSLNLIGQFGLRTLSIASLFPVNEYPWVRPGSVEGQKYVDFFEKWRTLRVPIRIVITRKDGSEWINMPCSIDNFVHGLTKTGDIRYSLDLREFPFVKVV